MNLSDHYIHLYNEPALTRGYRDLADLRQPEVVIFSQLRDRFLDKRILDLGVGCGRTTPHFLNLSRRYTGADYSQHMLKFCTERFPDVDFQFCDARAMQFNAASFDVVAFLGSGIDCVTHDDRLKIISEVFRVLTPGGTFVFNSMSRHRRRDTFREVFHLFEFKSLRGTLSNYYHLLDGIRNRIKNRKFEIETDEYAIRPTPANYFDYPLYHISKTAQARQLRAVGFHEIQSWDDRGVSEEIEDEDIVSGNFHYAAKRPVS